jgi:hypothetical protein
MAEPKKPVKKTLYFDEENIAAMKRERLRRIAAGTPPRDTDLSDLANEALKQAFRSKGGR